MTMTGMNRFWGTTAPPKLKSEFFSALTSPAGSGDGDVATIRMYGPIDSYGGWWGISASDVGEVLDALPESVSEIVLRVNSPGGEVYEALGILNMLRAHKAKVTAVVDGLAASAGSVVAVGCDETVMSPGTTMMIHSPSTFAWGNAEDLRKSADVLDSVERSIIEIYEAKAGPSDWARMLSEETWLTGKEAVELGLADRVAVIPDAGTTATAGADQADPFDEPEGDNIEDLVHFRFAAYQRRLSGSNRPSSPEPGKPIRKENAVAYSDLQAGLRERLGVTDAAATDEMLLAALDESLTEQADTPAAPAATIPAGTQIIEDSVLDGLRADAQAGREAREQQISDRRQGVIDAALREGRITAASAPQFRTMLDADETNATALIQSMAPNTVPVNEIGHAAGEKSAEDALYALAGGTSEGTR